MPRLPALRVGVLAELARQLRYEPPAAARRHLARAEDLAHQLIDGSPDSNAPASFPEDWIVFRITGLRGDGIVNDAESPAMVVREALVADLPALIDRLSAAAALSPADHPDSAWLSAAAVCSRWGVSRKTLERYRRRGLVSRRIALGAGRQRVVFQLGIVESFERRFADDLNDARGFVRLSAKERASIVSRAARYRARFGWSLHRCAQRLAPRFGRSIECVRGVLRARDAASPVPIFDDPPPLDRKQAARLESLTRRGGKVRAAASAMRKSRSTAHRAVNLARADRLRSLTLAGPVGADFDTPAAARTILAHDAARSNLGAPGATHAAEVLRQAQQFAPEPAAFERARAIAYWYLVHSAHAGVSRLHAHHPASAELDRIETALRWASRLKAEMVRSQLPLLMRTIETQSRRPIANIPPDTLRELVVLGLDALIESVDRFDPFKGGRLAAPAGVALARAISAWFRGPGMAALTRAASSAPHAEAAQRSIDDWTLRLHDWQRELDLPRAARDAIDTLDADAQRVLRLRFGLGASPPMTVADTALALGLTSLKVHAVQRKAMAALLGHWPDGGGGVR